MKLVALGISLLVAGIAVLGCGDDTPSAEVTDQPAVEDPGPVHVHGLGVNPRDRALFIATHTGLFRAADGELRAERVGDRLQDTMGFTVVGPDRFLGSGHPDGRDGLPPFLGLISSRDAGRSWQPMSLLGEADFHVLEAGGRQVYGFGSNWDTRQEQFLVSSDGGRRWSRRDVPEPLIALSVDPGDPAELLASGSEGLWRSTDSGRRWEALAAESGLLARIGRRIYLVGADGGVRVSSDGGRGFSPVGELGGGPAALEAAGNRLYAALHDGSIKSSKDGAEWSVRLHAPGG